MYLYKIIKFTRRNFADPKTFFVVANNKQEANNMVYTDDQYGENLCIELAREAPQPHCGQHRLLIAERVQENG